ncbi:hypothetical protein FS837_012490 [Tulasnella sp. UAMH 9824]|nr:hypothetical protein FS837_012490 [Tulasnella sp. UAMH 9824]
MESIPNLNDVIEQLQYQQPGYWLAAGGAALFFYDWLLSLDREIQLREKFQRTVVSRVVQKVE